MTTSYPSEAHVVGSARRDSIIEAAWECIQDKGLKRTTIADVARQAGIARVTVYQYFANKGEIAAAVLDWTIRSFHAAMAEDMARGQTLAEQLALGAGFMARTRMEALANQQAFDRGAVAEMLADYSGALLAATTDFFTPYFETARLRGEIRPDADTRESAEWFARIVISLYTTPSRHLDLNSSEVAAKFVTNQLVVGLEFGKAHVRAGAPPLSAVAPLRLDQS